MDEIMIAAYQRKIRELEDVIAGHEVRADQRHQQLMHTIRYLRSWAGLISLIDTHYPPDVCDGSSGDPGPRVITLIRAIDRLRRPCQCDPPGSGTYCNRCCQVHVVAERMAQQWDLGWLVRHVLRCAVQEVRGSHATSDEY